MRPVAFSLPFWLLSAGTLAADPPSLQTAVRHAVAAHQVRDSDLKGLTQAGERFRATTREGGVLVGLEVGLGRAGAAERVLAVRPVYRLGRREWPGPAAGDFLAPDVTRTVRSVAWPGYAVGGVWVNAGGDIAGLALTYYRVRGPWLDAGDRYESGWLGAKADPAELLDGRGHPVVGLFGRVEGGSLRALGLTFADFTQPAPQAAAPVAPRPPSDLEIENEALRAARAEARPDPSGLSWYAGFAGVTVLAGLGLAGIRAWRRRKRARPEAAGPVLKQVSPLLAAQWLPIRPRAGGLSVPGEEDDGGQDPLAPPSIPAPPIRPRSSGTFQGLWR